MWACNFPAEIIPNEMCIFLTFVIVQMKLQASLFQGMDTEKKVNFNGEKPDKVSEAICLDQLGWA